MSPSSAPSDFDPTAWWQVSVQARVSMLPTAEGGRSVPIWEDYRPNHKLREGVFCSGGFSSIEGGHIAPGETGLAEVSFLVIGELTGWFKPGFAWQINEGGRTVGQGEVLAVLSTLPADHATAKKPDTSHSPDAPLRAANESTVAWHKLLVEADIVLLSAAEGGRTHPVWENWAPNHVFGEGIHCAGRLTRVTGEKIMPGDAGRTHIEFTVADPNHVLFTPGAEWEIHERGAKVGSGRVRSVRRQTQPSCRWREKA